MEWLEISPGIRIVSRGPGIWFPGFSCICIADLHLGYEWSLLESGISLPGLEYGWILESLAHLRKMTGARKLIINGDLKHEFGGYNPQELIQIPRLLQQLNSEFQEIILVKGNHDRSLGIIKRYLEVVDVLELGSNLILHGHELIQPSQGNRIIIAHEHPVILLGELQLGYRIRARAFLRGAWKSHELILMPSFSEIPAGTEMNLRDRFLSPYLSSQNVAEMEVYLVDPQAGILEFPKLGLWADYSLSI